MSAAVHNIDTKEEEKVQKIAVSHSTQRRKPGRKPNVKVKKFYDRKSTQIFITCFIIYALFGEDIRRFFEKPVDDAFYTLSTIALCVFILEMFVQSVASPEYVFSFYFWLDIISTASIIPDIGWLFDELLQDDAGQDAAEGLTHAKTSRSGAKAARFVRVVRLVRMVRVIKLYKMAQKNEGESEGEDLDISIGGGSKVGKQLTEQTTRKVVMLILILVLMLPFADLDYLADRVNTHQTRGLTAIHRLPMDVNSTGQIEAETLKQMVKQYGRDAGKLMYFNISNCDPKYCRISWLPNETDQWLLTNRYHNGTIRSGITVLDYFSPHLEQTSPITQANFAEDRQTLDEIGRRFRSDEAERVEQKGCFLPGSPNVVANTEKLCTSVAIFYVKDAAIVSAGFGILKTLVIMVILVTAAFFFSQDAETFVIAPLDRMIKLVTQLSKNPLAKVTRQKNPSQQMMSTHNIAIGANLRAMEEDYETAMIEDTLAKIGQLLQVGFGAAGKDIIAANMQEGDVKVLMPGHKVTCVFGFGIIESFTETVGCLEAKITQYINTIAKIVHTGVANYYGGANKNMGGAFLLAWKICDGQLPGLRDPRDKSPVGGEEEKKGGEEGNIAERRRRIRINVSGAGAKEREITPDEMVDSSLAAFIKVRVDLNSAHDKGHLVEYIHHPKMNECFGGNFRVVMGFGLHIGWAIEGAIGSQYKMDVSYLSPNVNLSARLEAATHQFECPMLMSEWFVGELSPEARRLCRLIDRVTVKGSVIPMSLYTFDIITYPPHVFEPQFNTRGRQERAKFNSDAVRALRSGVAPEFFVLFDQAVQHYLQGSWSEAREALKQVQALRAEDGPTKSLLRQMEKFNFQAPNDWKGFRALTSK